MATDETSSKSDSASDDDEPVILSVKDVPMPYDNQLPVNETNSLMHESVIKQRSTSNQDNTTMDTIAVSNKPDIVPSVARQQHRGVFPQGMLF